MNYLNMVNFIETAEEYSIARFYPQRREEEFRNYLGEKISMIPYFMVLEAIFQTAGRVIRENSKLYSRGGVIAGMKNFKFVKPMIVGQEFFIKTTLISTNQRDYYFNIKMSTDSELTNLALESGKLIISAIYSTEENHFNMEDDSNVERTLKGLSE